MDASGALVRSRIVSIEDGSASVVAFEPAGPADRGPEITLLQALPERARMELIIQKTTELGVTRIVPFRSERSTSVEELDARQPRSHNWQRVALKAAKQSRGWGIPEVLACGAIDAAMDMASGAALKIMLWEKAGAPGLKEVLSGAERPVNEAFVLVGPEGGLTDDEAARAAGKGFKAASAGARILRTETAAILAVALLRYELGG